MILHKILKAFLKVHSVFGMPAGSRGCLNSMLFTLFTCRHLFLTQKWRVRYLAIIMFFDSLKDFFALSLRVQGSTFNKKSLGKKVFISISIYLWFRKKEVYLRYGPTFLGKMFLKFGDERIKIIDSHYLVWNHTNSKTKQNINYVIQVKFTLFICFDSKNQCRQMTNLGMEEDRHF